MRLGTKMVRSGAFAWHLSRAPYAFDVGDLI